MFAITNVVMVAHFDQEIDLNKLYKAIPIENFSNHKVKSKIPYIGIEGIFVNKSYDGNSEGIRKSSATMKQIITLDVQYNGKNNHVKVSDGKFHITGLKSVENAKETIDYVKLFINKIHEHIINIRNNKIDTLNEEYVKLTTYKNIEDVEFFMKSDERIQMKNYKIENIMYHKAQIKKLNLLTLMNSLVENKKEIVVNYNNFISPQVMKILLKGKNPIKAKIYAKGGFMLTSKSEPKLVEEFYESLKEYIAVSYID